MSDPAQMRILGRAARPIARVIFGLIDGQSAIALPTSVAHAWLYIPSTVESINSCRHLIHPERAVLGITAAELIEQRGAAFLRRLEDLSLRRCEAVVLENASATEIKAGTPFHRLSQFRERGLVQMFFVDAADYATAEWMLNHTPAHAVALPFGLADQSAKFRLLEEAGRFGTGIIARPVTDPLWTAPPDIETDLRFILSDPALSSVMVPLSMADEVDQALHNPMSTEERERWWQQYQAAVPQPPMPTRNLPPEYGA